MKESNSKTAFPVLLFAFVFIFLLGGRLAVVGQWLSNEFAVLQGANPGGQLKEENKTHWPQLPDYGLTGIDVEMTQYPLADDFKCLATGPISDIHFWASFADPIACRIQMRFTD